MEGKWIFEEIDHPISKVDSTPWFVDMADKSSRETLYVLWVWEEEQQQEPALEE